MTAVLNFIISNLNDTASENMGMQPLKTYTLQLRHQDGHYVLFQDDQIITLQENQLLTLGNILLNIQQTVEPETLTSEISIDQLPTTLNHSEPAVSIKAITTPEEDALAFLYANQFMKSE